MKKFVWLLFYYWKNLYWIKLFENTIFWFTKNSHLIIELNIENFHLKIDLYLSLELDLWKDVLIPIRANVELNYRPRTLTQIEANSFHTQKWVKLKSSSKIWAWYRNFLRTNPMVNQLRCMSFTLKKLKQDIAAVASVTPGHVLLSSQIPGHVLWSGQIYGRLF